MRFELNVGSNVYTLHADDLQLAAVADVLLTNGSLGLSGSADGDLSVPALAAAQLDGWFIDHFGLGFDACASHCLRWRNDALARALESVTLVHGPGGRLEISAKARELAVGVRRRAGVNRSTSPATGACADHAPAAMQRQAEAAAA